MDILRIQSFNVNRTVLTQLASFQFSRTVSCSCVSDDDDDDDDNDSGDNGLLKNDDDDDEEYTDSCSKEACLARNEAYISESDGNCGDDDESPRLLSLSLLLLLPPGGKKKSSKSS
jgi:hypothetical protein